MEGEESMKGMESMEGTRPAGGRDDGEALLRRTWLYGALAAACVKMGADNDIWHVLLSGRDAVERGVLYWDDHTAHGALSLLPTKWLSHSLFYLAWRRGGEPAAVMIAMALSLLTAFLMRGACLKAAGGRRMPAALAAAGFAYLMSYCGFFATRPQSFTFAVMAAELWCLEAHAARLEAGATGWRALAPLAALPAVSCLEANLHGTVWPCVILAALPYAAGPVLDKGREGLSAAAGPSAAIALMIPAGMLSPCGPGLFRYIWLEMAHDGTGHIMELRPMQFGDAASRPVFLAGLLVALLRAARRYDRLPPARHVLLASGFLVMALMAVRNTEFFIIGAAPLAAWMLANGKPRQKAPPVPAPALAAAAALSLAILVTGSLSPLGEGRAYRQEREAAANAALAAAGEGARAYAPFNDGGYLEWRGLRCYIDPRMELFFKGINGKADVWDEYVGLQYEGADAEAFLTRYRFDVMVAQDGDAVLREALRGGWREVPCGGGRFHVLVPE